MPECFVFVFFCVILRFFSLEDSGIPNLRFSLEKNEEKTTKKQKRKKKRNKLRRVLTKRKQNTNMQSTLSQLVSFLFVLGKNADFRFRSLQRKRHKKNTMQSTLAQFISYLFFPFRMFLWFVFLVCFLVV